MGNYKLKSSNIIKFTSICFAVIITNIALGQGNILISPGTFIKSNNSNIVFNNINTITNNGAIDLDNASTLTGNNQGTTILSGTGTTSVGKLVLNNTNELSLQQNVTIKNNIQFNNGKLNLNNNVIQLQPNAVLLNETENNRCYSQGTGQLTITQQITNGTTSNPGNLGIIFTNPNNMGTTTITRGFTPQSGSGGLVSSIARYYDVLPTNASMASSDMSLHYFDAELNNQDENNLSIWQSNNNTSWATIGGSIINTSNNSASNYGINTFGRFALGNELYVAINTKVLLGGAYNTSNGLMSDSLRLYNLIPLSNPYTSAPYNTLFTNTISNASATITSSVLSVTGNNAIVDWVLVELRNKSNAAQVLQTVAALIQRDGDIVTTDGSSAVRFTGLQADDYYIAVRHRNHLGIMSAAAIALSNTTTYIDFSSISTPLYTYTGTNSNPSPLTGATRNIVANGGMRRLMYAGNCNISLVANAHRIVSYTNYSNSDRTGLVNAIGITGTTTGYSIFDLNFDGKARFNGLNPDRLVILNNTNNSNTTTVNEQIAY
jgi:hypothetical protein